MTNANKFRDEVDTVRTMYWYEGLRRRTTASTSYALERKIEPESFKKNADGDPIHRNKWPYYKRGQHTPSDSLVTRANSIVVGSARELNHVLWKALRAEWDTDHAIEWLRELDPELQLLIFEQREYARIHGGSRFLGQLERRASLDALAALTILLRINHESGLSERTWEYAFSVFRVLLIMGGHFENRGLAEAIFSLYVSRIFRFVTWNNRRLYLDEYDYPWWTQVLQMYGRNTAQTKGRSIGWREHTHSMLKILGGKYGFDLKFAIEPLVGPDTEIGPPSSEEVRSLHREIRKKNWAVENLRTGGKERLPPAEIFEGP